jgi:acetyltransferase-like isoleucine patch superfamily enzyme
MHIVKKILPALVLLTLSSSILAETFIFRYEFIGETNVTVDRPNRPGVILEGRVNGTLQPDGKTVVIDSIDSFHLGGDVYQWDDNSEFRAFGDGNLPHLTLDGSSIELLGCPEGFTDGSGDDCSFTAHPGFVFSTAGLAEAYGAPGFSNYAGAGDGTGNAGRALDTPLDTANWQMVSLSRPFETFEPFKFQYEFIGVTNITEERPNRPGVILVGVVNGALQSDTNTVQIDSIEGISLGDVSFPWNEVSEFRGVGAGNVPHLTLDGSSYEILACPEGFTGTPLPDGGDCSFTDHPGFVFSTAGLAEVFGDPNNNNYAGTGDGTGNAGRALDIPLNTSNWQLSSASENFIFTYEYVYGASQSATMTGTVQGVVLPAGDEVLITSFGDVSVNVDGTLVPLPSIEPEEIRARDFSQRARVSFSGDILDFWVCSSGFTRLGVGGGDCPFREEGGIAIVPDYPGFPDGIVSAGGDGVRAFATAIVKGGWLLQRDTDEDGIVNDNDLCPLDFDPLQEDVNGDGLGDACVSPDVVIPEGVDLGDNVSIDEGVSLSKDLDIGDNTSVGKNVTVGKGTSIGSDVEVSTDSTLSKETTIGGGVTIGSDVKIAKGVIIGSNVVIGDGTVISKDVTIEDNVTIGFNVFIDIGATITSLSVVDDDEVVGKYVVYPE